MYSASTERVAQFSSCAPRRIAPATCRIKGSESALVVGRRLPSNWRSSLPRPRTLDAQALLLDPRPFWAAVQRYRGWTDKELHNIVVYSLGERVLNFDPDRELLCLIYAPAFEGKNAKH